MLIAFNKPFGVICKFRPEPGRRTLADYISVANVYPAGRLDTEENWKIPEQMAVLLRPQRKS